MGFIDGVILSTTILTLAINALLLMVSLHSTESAGARLKYKRTYMPVIVLCILVLVLYFGLTSISNAMFKVMSF